MAGARRLGPNPVPEETLEIKHGRMVHLGFGKYWRSDQILGLCPIEE